MVDLSRSLGNRSATHTGMVRSHNEDTIGSDPVQLGWRCWPDGMGATTPAKSPAGSRVALVTKQTPRTALPAGCRAQGDLSSGRA